MTIANAISAADALLSNEIAESVKVRWLNELDEQIWYDLILTHEREADAGSTYTAHTETTDSLIVPDFASGLYVEYLIMQINLAHGETERYNAAAAVFQNKLQSYVNWYNRTHMPVRGPDLSF